MANNELEGKFPGLLFGTGYILSFGEDPQLYRVLSTEYGSTSPNFVKAFHVVPIEERSKEYCTGPKSIAVAGKVPIVHSTPPQKNFFLSTIQEKP